MVIRYQMIIWNAGPKRMPKFIHSNLDIWNSSINHQLILQMMLLLFQFHYEPWHWTSNNILKLSLYTSSTVRFQFYFLPRSTATLNRLDAGTGFKDHFRIIFLAHSLPDLHSWHSSLLLALRFFVVASILCDLNSSLLFPFPFPFSSSYFGFCCCRSALRTGWNIT